MYLKRLITGSVAVLVAAIVASTLTAAGDAKPPRIVAAVMQDADGDGHADRVGLVYSERVRHARRQGWQVPVPGRGLQDPGSRRGEREHGCAHAGREDCDRRCGAAFGSLRADKGRIDPRPRKEPGGDTGVPGDSSAPEPTARDPAAPATSESRSRRSRRGRRQRPAGLRAGGSRRSGPERRMRRTSRSSTRTATASTGTRRERSSPHHWARTRTRARRQRPSARSRQPSSRPPSPKRTSTRQPVTTAGSRRRVASASSGATTPRPGNARRRRSRRSAARRTASTQPAPPASCSST